jgi:hypothetical protein
MGDMGDLYNDLKQGRKTLRDKHGVDCPRCPQVRPKATPSILLPQQRCKVDGYVDPRPRLSAEEVEACTGWRPA